MSPQLIEPRAFTRRLSDAIWATARGEAAPFIFARRWRSGCLILAMETGSGAFGAKIPGEFEPFDPVTGEMDQAACEHALAVGTDCLWTDLEAKRAAGPLGNDAWGFYLWDSVRDLLRPWIETGEPPPAAVDVAVAESWAIRMREMFLATLKIFPDAAEEVARVRGRATRTPGRGSVVDLARFRASTATRH